MVNVSIREALEYVAEHPVMETDVLLDVKVYELVARTLYGMANNPDAKVRGSMRRASRAQRILLNRLVGTRRPGTHPAAREKTGLTFIDLTRGALP